MSVNLAAVQLVRSDVAQCVARSLRSTGLDPHQLELEITVEHRRKRALATVTKLPFFDPPRKRA